MKKGEKETSHLLDYYLNLLVVIVTRLVILILTGTLTVRVAIITLVPMMCGIKS